MSKKYTVILIIVGILLLGYSVFPIAKIGYHKLSAYVFSNFVWIKDVGDYAEHSIIQDGILYQTATSEGVYMLNPDDGSTFQHWKFGAGSATAPVVIGDYIYAWSYVDKGGSRLYKINKNTGESSFIVGMDVDFEVLTVANIDGIDLLFIPKDGYITAIKTSDLSTYWVSEVSESDSIGHWDGGLLANGYLYTRQESVDNNKLVKLDLETGKILDEVKLDSEGYYASLLYDEDGNQIILTERNTLKVKAFDAYDFSKLNWTYTMEEPIGSSVIMYGGSYHDGVYYISDKERDSGEYSFMYAIDTKTGKKIWKNSEAYNVKVTMANTILGDKYLFVPTHDYLDADYQEMMVIDIDTGLLYDTIYQSSDSACASPSITGGIIFLGMWTDHRVNAIRLGSGEYLDTPYKMDAYHTGYIGKRLTEYIKE